MEKVTSLDHLKKLTTSRDGTRVDLFILLGRGFARSSKQISYDPEYKVFSVVNEIDFSFQDDLTDEDLESQTHIVEAIEKGVFYKY
ncbi:MAG TPA: hypothetical protein VFJ43_13220 [Bacteroidia bacterium]|nr:hypothetical protein [Bacteroidia bacterium]